MNIVDYTKEHYNVDAHSYNVAETFVGCGGSHFGFKNAKFNSVFANDIWSDALETLKLNDKDISPNIVIHRDVSKLDKTFLQSKNINTDNVDVLIGGVVCKGFSLAGIRNPYDDRNYLYLQQLRLVKELRPKISIIENVPGMLSMKILKKDEAIKILCEELTTICDNHKSKRGQLIALNKQNDDPEAIKKCKEELEQLSKKRKEKEKVLQVHKYNVVEDIERIYKELGYKTYKKILKCSEFDCATNRRRLFIVAIRNDLKKEWTYPKTITADNMPTVKNALDKLDLNGINKKEVDKDNVPMNHRAKTIEKFKKIKSDVKSKTGYFSRGTNSRLSFNKPAPTLVPGHSSFQIHPTEHRSITVREGATITSFPTNFKFYGSHTSRCIQIGNAIPVNMAFSLAKQCKLFLDSCNET